MNFRKVAVSMMAMVLTFGMSAVAFANEAAGGAAGGSREQLVQFGAALALGIAALGGAFAQSKVAAAALEGIARNPAAQGKLFIPMVIGLALIESLVLYAFVIAFKALA